MATPSTMAVWRAPTDKDLSASISDTEIEAYREAAHDEDAHGDPITALLVRGVNFVRGFMRANTGIAMGPAGTLPESLIAPCMDYIAFDVVKRVPRSNTEDRRAARREAVALFKLVRSGDFDVESYNAQETQGAGVSVEVAVSSRRRVTAASLEGL